MKTLNCKFLNEKDDKAKYIQTTEYGLQKTEIQVKTEFQGYEFDKALYLELNLWVVQKKSKRSILKVCERDCFCFATLATASRTNSRKFSQETMPLKKPQQNQHLILILPLDKDGASASYHIAIFIYHSRAVVVVVVVVKGVKDIFHARCDGNSTLV